MRTPRTPALRTVGKGHKNWPTPNHLNISRKILQKSVCSNNRRVDALQMNNVQLARRVSELQMDLSQRNAELQACKAEVFRLRVVLNRQQNSHCVGPLFALRDILVSVIDNASNAHEIVMKACEESDGGYFNAAIDTSALTIGSRENFVDMSLAENQENAIVEVAKVSNGVAAVNYSGEDIVCEEEDKVDDVTIARPSVQSVVMEYDSFSRTPEALANAIVVVQPLPGGACGLDNVSNYPAPLAATITSGTPTSRSPKPRPHISAKTTKRPTKARSMQRKKGTKADTRQASLFSSHTVHSLDSSTDHHIVDEKGGRSSKIQQERSPIITPPKSPRLILLSVDLDKSPKTLKMQGKKAKKTVKTVHLEMDSPESETKSAPSRRGFTVRDQLSKKPIVTRVRRRVKIIPDDSVFIPISDSMMVVMPSQVDVDAATAADTTEVDTIPALLEEDKCSPLTPIRKSGVKSVSVQILTTPNKGTTTMTPSRPDVPSDDDAAAADIPKTKKKKLTVEESPITISAVGAEEHQRPLSMSDTSSNRASDNCDERIGRPSRRKGTVSYMVKLNTKLRQGDADWCKH